MCPKIEQEERDGKGREKSTACMALKHRKALERMVGSQTVTMRSDLMTSQRVRA
jgi:hypothetical protein